MRVPTVAMWKGKIPAGKIYGNITSQMDWFPTIATLTESTLPADLVLDGEDISQVLLADGERPTQKYLYFDGGNPQAYRSGDYKIKEPYEGYKGSSGKMKVAAHDTLLIDLVNDIGSKNNLYSSNKALAKQLFTEKNVAYAALDSLPPPLIIRTQPDNSHYQYLKEKHAVGQIKIQ
jgi:arylsulfatase A-like enzyme